MKKYKTPKGNVLSEEELKAKYGERFDSLVLDGTLTLVEGSEDEKKNPIGTSNSNSQEGVMDSTTGVDQQPGSLDSSNQITGDNTTLFITPAGNEVSQKELIEKYGNQFYDLVEDGTLKSSGNKTEVIEEEIIFDETLLENQELLFENQANINILNSVGYFDQNKPELEFMPGVDKNKFYIKSQETGEFNLLKDNEIQEDVLKAIKLYEQANSKDSSYNKRESIILTNEDYLNSERNNSSALIANSIDVDDYLKWEKSTTRQEGSAYNFFKQLISSEESDEYYSEKREYEKLQGYQASLLNDITLALSANKAAQSFATTKEEVIALKKEGKNLQKAFITRVQAISSTIDSFKVYKKWNETKDLEKRRKLYNAVQKGGFEEVSIGGQELMGTITTGLSSFAMEFIAGIPALIDQRLASDFGFDKKGALAGLSEMFSDSADSLELSIGETSRPAFQEGKLVLYNGEEFVVGENGTVFDKNTNIRMDGIIPNDKIKEIQTRAKDVPDTFINWTGGAVATGGVNLVNLYALIRTGGKVNKAAGFKKYVKPGTAGKLGMGVASFTSGVSGNVDDIRSQLMATGMSEKESMNIAVNAGQAIATLDGVFSGLAGSNEGLLIGFQGIKDQIKNLAIKEGKNFTKKQLKDKFGSLVKENMKELFIEEMPVLFAEKGINYLVNQKIGKDVLSSKVSKAEMIETAVMTIGATSALGSRGLLSGNNRKDLIRTVAKDVDDLKVTLDVLVKEGSLTKGEAKNAYDEVYNMQAAELKTQGTIKVSENVEEAADLLNQRQALNSRKEGLEGPLEEEIDKQIEAVDAQIKKLHKRDLEAAQTIIDKERDGKKPVEVTKEEAVEALKEENEFRLKSKLPAILESEENILKKQNELIKDKQNAIQKSSTEKVPAQKSPGDSQKVGEGDSVEVVASESNAQNQNENQAPKEEVTSKERVNQVVEDVIQKTRARNKRRGNKNNKQSEADNAIKYLEQSKLFKESNDSEREAMVQEINAKLGVEIPSPTIKQIDAKKNKKKLNKVDEAAALKDQIKLEVKAAKDSKKDQTNRRQSLANAISNLQKIGNINLKKAKALIKEISGVNLNNAKKVQDVIDFTEKAMNDAEYSAKISKAKELQSSIKKNLKGKEASLSDAAKKFSKVNPSNVADIDVYLKNAESIKKGLQKTKIIKEGVKTSSPFDVKKIDTYSVKEIEEQKKRNYELAKQSFQELTGLDSKEMTLDELKEALYEVKGKVMTVTEKEKFLKNKQIAIDKALNNAFQNAKINIKASKEYANLNKQDKKTLRGFLNMNLNFITDTAKKMDIIDSIVNFEINQSTGGMQAILSQYTGDVEMRQIKKDGIKTRLNSSWLSRKWNKAIATLPNAFELVFKSQSKARKVMDAMGVNGVINGSAEADTESTVIEGEYASAFEKKKMKSGIYFDEANDVERGVLGEIRRFAPNTEAEQQKEFNKGKNLIKKTYEKLLNSSDKNKNKQGQTIKDSYDKLLADSNSISEVEAKSDPANLEGVKYMTDVWASKYDALAEVSLNVYNRNLGKDINYLPRSLIRIKLKKETPDITQPVFNPDGMRTKAYDKETGVLKVATKPSELPEGKILNLSFDKQNINNLKAALTDINTAPSIQQIKGARESNAYKDIFVNEQSESIITQRINEYVDMKRGNRKVDNEDSVVLSAVNKLATFGVVKALGGITQPIKQLVPIFNTATNSGINNTRKGIALAWSNKDANKAIDDSGMAIANRGLQAQSDLEPIDSRIEKAATSKKGKAINAIDSANKFILQQTLVRPDVFAARASFLAYYIQAMDKKGISSNDIDWSKPLNKEAKQFAQQQVDRQQNTSDQDLQGGLFTSQTLGVQIVRKTLFPFANFLLNQKTRMYSDINTLIRNPTALPGDKTAAAKSLAGLGVETFMFNAIGLGITSTLSNLLENLIGEDEEEEGGYIEKQIKKREAKAKKFKNQLTGRTGNALADVISPIPVLNDIILSQANSLLGLLQEGEDDPWKFFANTKKGLNEQLGVLGIPNEKRLKLTELIKMAQSGKATSEYMGVKSTKEISKDAQDKAGYVAVAYALYLAGVLPFSEVGYLSERALKELKKRKKSKPKKFVEEKKSTMSLSSNSKFKGGGLNSKNKLSTKSKL